MKHYILIGSLLALMACGNPSTQTQENRPQPVVPVANVPITSNTKLANMVHSYIAAFNKRDMDAMLNIAHPDIEWISLEGRDLLLGADGAENLRSVMEKYFDGCASCRSSLKWTKTTEERVVALEEASWDVEGERKAQSSLSVYEFENDKIRRVYYYPAE